MAKKKIDESVSTENLSDAGAKDITSSLIKSLNSEFGFRTAYNLGTEIEVPTNIKTWISTGCVVLDYIISNRRNGGLPGGRVIELAGPPSCGKSHIAYQAAAVTQKMGGIVVYIDTENATSVEKLNGMGINVKSRFVYVDQHCTEHIFTTIETVVKKAVSLTQSKKDIPILVVWDSVANSSPKAELEGNYDDSTMALQARTIAKGMRKIVGFLGENNVTLLCINQLKHSMSMMGDAWFTPGGKAIPFAASVRIRITSARSIIKDGMTIGINVNATIKKNKITYPDRKTSFDIMYGRGTDDTESIHNEIWTYCKNQKKLEGKKNHKPIIVKGNECNLLGDGAWKEFTVIDQKTGEVFLEKKYQKNGFKRLLDDETTGPILYEMLDRVMVYDLETQVSEDDELNYEETPNGEIED